MLLYIIQNKFIFVNNNFNGLWLYAIILYLYLKESVKGDSIIRKDLYLSIKIYVL